MEVEEISSVKKDQLNWRSPLRPPKVVRRRSKSCRPSFTSIEVRGE